MNQNIQSLLDAGQRLWLNNITRELLVSGQLAHYISTLSITGLTSNPTIFERAIAGSEQYDETIALLAARGLIGEALFFELALQDLSEAAALFYPVFLDTDGVDGWVSIEVSPLLADDAAASVGAAAQLCARAHCPNLFIKIPGTRAGLLAIEQSIVDGVPVNVTLLFSCAQWQAAAEAYLRALERRLVLGLDLRVASVASLFISRWDVAVAAKTAPVLRNRLGITMAKRCYRAHRELIDSARWRRLAAAGARPQRLLWASTGTKDPSARDTLYVESLAARDTIDTIPEQTLLAYADHGIAGAALSADGGDGEAEIALFERAGIAIELLAAQLQREGVQVFANSWGALLSALEKKSRITSR